jgi:hypothetical protein
MAERAPRPAETKKAGKPRRARIGRGSKAESPAISSATSGELRSAKKRARASKAMATDPNTGSAYFQHLNALAAKADRGEAIDSTGMSGDDFLTSFLGR